MTVFQEALAGLSKTFSAESKKSSHAAFIESQLLPTVQKLQKEIGWRRYKECQAPLQEAVLSLKIFQHEEWPDKNNKNSDHQSDALRHSSHDGKEESSEITENDDQMTVESQEVEETGTAVTMDKTDSQVETKDEIDYKHEASTPQSEQEEESKEEAFKPEASKTLMIKTLPDESFHDARNFSIDDDPQTRELVHPAILQTLEAFIMVLRDPTKQPRPTEIVLEGVTSIVANRYLSGRAGEESKPASLLHRLLESVAKSSESNNEAVQIVLISTLTTIMTSPKCSVHGNSMLTALRSTFHVYLVTKSATCKASAKRALLDMLKAVFFRMEAHEAVSHNSISPSDMQSVASKDSDTPTSITSRVSNANSFASQYHADAYYLLRSLCKLSSKELPADTTDEAVKGKNSRILFNTVIPTDPTELNSKILSLELILAAMEYSGEAFTSSKFLYLVQHYLCGSLLKNCVSTHTQVAFLSQKIFLVLVYKFKGHLKQDIEVFMSNVFFRVLESQNSSFKQKALVLESLRSLCKDPVLLTQIFLNYDCDFDAMNLYKDIVHMLTKLGGKATSVPSVGVMKREVEQEFELSLAAIECLVTILKAFLRALGLPAGDDNDNDTAGARIRGMLQLDSALAAPDDHNSNRDSDADSLALDDANSVSSGLQLQPNLSVEGGPTVGSDVAVKIVDAFDRKRNAEQNFEIGSVKFTLSLKIGLNFFIDNVFVECDAKAIALFFLANKDKLDKTQMGEALGREPDAAFVKGKDVEADKGGSGFWFRILHYYAGALDFTGIVFDEAIRLFLSGFRLPGEAQKIDRIMEKFAERYTSQNPSVFPSSDTAFILAFSVIMLNTDLHNPSIKPEKRMTADSFLRNNRGIGENNSDVPDEVLRGIFERIKDRPFSLKEDDAARERVGAQKQIFDTSLFFEGASTLFGTSAEERKRENFKKERDEMMAVTEQLIRRRPEKNSLGSAEKDSRFSEAISPADVVKPMFDVTWGPMIGILSQVLECSDDDRSVAVCLNGFVFAVRLAAHGRMSLARDTFVSSLAKFTFLGSIKEMKRKNVESIRTLLSVAVIDGEYLGESWGPVLQCMSQLARLRLSASGLDSDESFLMVESPSKAANSRPDAAKGGLFRTHTPGEIAREAEESNGKAVLEAVQEVLIDKVFSSTVNLSAKSLAHFVEQLIMVASSEVAGNSKSGITGVDASKAISDHSSSGNGASIFSLQRLVDVADYNMDVRPRLVWAQIWELMADFFVNLACHDNRMVSFFAIDSLKQLSLKFLEKPELSEFNFQCSFLKPFMAVMEDKGTREDIRELVLHCIDNIIGTKSHNLRSGWKIVFSILTLSAGDPSEKIEYLGLSILQRLLDEHLDDIGSLADKNVVETGSSSEELSSLDKRNRNANADDFVCLCRASLSFVQFDGSDSLRPFGLTMRAFCHAAIYADLLAAQRVLPPISGAQWSDPCATGYTYSAMAENESLAMVVWRPLFEGLADGVRSTAKTSSSGFGCLVQRGSILTLRAILLRHGHLFSTSQLAAILRETILPAIQHAAMGDTSAVVAITSESPTISNIDFLVNSPPLPPDNDDPALQQFQALNSTPKRPVGPAELMLEASFTDLRHGGDGDLCKAYLLAKKLVSDEVKVTEQPFPDSWVATTAPLALGLLTDITTEFVVYREAEGQEILWPIIEQQYKLWCVGRAFGTERNDPNADTKSWFPCEALVRIACRELYRLPRRLFADVEFISFAKSSQITWVSIVLNLFSVILTKSVQVEDVAWQNLLDLKEQETTDRKCLGTENLSLVDESSNEELIDTPFGSGRIDRESKYFYLDPEGGIGTELVVNVVKLDFGATLYQPVEGSLALVEHTSDARQIDTNRIPLEVDVPDAYWVHVVPTLKIRCVAAFCLQQSLVAVLDGLVSLASKDDIAALLHSLHKSQRIAANAARDEDISMAFQEALMKDWGDGIRVPNEDTETTARLSLLHGSAVFFLSQEAGATKAIVHLLSALYLDVEKADINDWNRVDFAETHLISIMTEVLEKFLASEEKDGHLVDPNVWRNASENGGKVALYCTSFASVTVDILKILLAIRPAQFKKYKHEFFPQICALVRVQSEEIRHIVQDILALHVAPFLGLKIPTQQRQRASTTTK